MMRRKRHRREPAIGMSLTDAERRWLVEIIQSVVRDDYMPEVVHQASRRAIDAVMDELATREIVTRPTPWGAQR